MRSSDARYRCLFEAVNDAIYLGVIADDGLPGKFVDVNRCACALLGYSKTELLEKSPSDIDAHLKPAELSEIIRRLLAEGTIIFETEHRAKDGRIIPVEIRTQIYQEDGQTMHLSVARDLTERRAASARLLQEHEKWQALFEYAPDACYLHDLEGRFLEGNRAAEELVGYSREELAGKRFPELDLLSPEGLARAAELVARNANGHATGPDELQLKRKDGVEITTEIRTYPVRVQGELLVLGVARDISRRKQAEEALRESEERFRSIIDNSAAGYFFLDHTGCFANVNATWLRLHKYESPQEILGRHFSVTQTEEDQSRAKEIVQSALSGGQPILGEFSRRCKDGSVGWHTFSVVPVRKGGSVIGLEGFLIDRTEHKKAEQDYRTLFRQMLDGFALHEILCDSAGKPFDYRFLAVNPAFERLTGLKANEILGRTVLEIMPGLEAGWIETYCKVALTGEPVFFENYSADLKKHFEVTAFRPGPSQFACIFADITERRHLEAQLRQAQKMEAIGQLAGGVAHDFNNILAAMLLDLGLARETPGLEGETDRLLNQVEMQAQRAANLIRQLLIFSRRSAFETKAVDVNESVENVLQMLRRLMGEHNELRFSSQQVPPVQADPGMLDQVLMNLAVNARDAMPKGGTITISTQKRRLSQADIAKNPNARPGDFVCLSVSDTGCGMDSATLQRLFEPFFTTKEPGKGTGLGLATVHGIVGQHKGWIEVESSLGKGSIFRVFLPATAERTSESGSKGEDVELLRGAEAILLVEDEAGLRLAAARALRALGYRVLEASHAPEAISVWNQNHATLDLLLTDMVMPGGMSGLELVKELRQLKPGLRAIVSSGYSAEMMDHGFSAPQDITRLPKPYKLELLASTVRRCLDRAN